MVYKKKVIEKKLFNDNYKLFEFSFTRLFSSKNYVCQKCRLEK